MNKVIIIKSGCEYPCWQKDNGYCSPACPQLCNKDGFTFGENLCLGMGGNITDFHCAVDRSYTNLDVRD